MPDSYWKCASKYYICQVKYKEALNTYRNMIESKSR